jgi:hypothetical protein
MSVMIDPPLDFNPMSCEISNPDNQQAIELTRQAHTAELDGNCQVAYNLHGHAVVLFTKAVADCEKMSEERRRAKLCLRAATDQQRVLGDCILGDCRPPKPLPSSVMLSKEWEGINGTVYLSKVCRKYLHGALYGL